MQQKRLTIEYCQGCDRHQFNTRHCEAKYYEYFTRVKEELESEFPDIVVSAKTGKPRVGAFEVVSESGVIYFSKLETRQFPAAGIFKKLVTEKDAISSHPKLEHGQAPHGVRSNRPGLPPPIPVATNLLTTAVEMMAGRSQSAPRATSRSDSPSMNGGSSRNSPSCSSSRNLTPMRYAPDAYSYLRTPNAPDAKSLAMEKSYKPPKSVQGPGVEVRHNAMLFAPNPYRELRSPNCDTPVQSGSRPSTPQRSVTPERGPVLERHGSQRSFKPPLMGRQASLQSLTSPSA